MWSGRRRARTHLECLRIRVVLIRAVRVEERGREKELDAARGLATVVGYLLRAVSARRRELILLDAAYVLQAREDRARLLALLCVLLVDLLERLGVLRVFLERLDGRENP